MIFYRERLFDHVHIVVSNLEASRHFYGAAIESLGCLFRLSVAPVSSWPTGCSSARVPPKWLPTVNPLPVSTLPHLERVVSTRSTGREAISSRLLCRLCPEPGWKQRRSGVPWPR